MGRQEVVRRREKVKKFHVSAWAFQRTRVQIPNRTINHVLFNAYKSRGINLNGEFGFTFAGIRSS
jgi:hypothetical protein